MTEWECEHCGTEMEKPADTETYRGYQEVVVIAFCDDCTGVAI